MRKTMAKKNGTNGSNRLEPDIESAKQIAADAEAYRKLDKHGVMISVPRWKFAAITGIGYKELSEGERRMAMDYICTDQAPEIIESFRKVGEELGRKARERIDAAVIRTIGGTE